MEPGAQSEKMKIRIEQHSFMGRPLGGRMAFYRRILAYGFLERSPRNRVVVVLSRCSLQRAGTMKSGAYLKLTWQSPRC